MNESLLCRWNSRYHQLEMRLRQEQNSRGSATKEIARLKECIEKHE